MTRLSPQCENEIQPIRKQIADLLWWSVPSSTNDEAKAIATDLLDRLIDAVRADSAAELAAVRAERDEARARVRELARPAVEAHRNEIRRSYAELAVTARDDRDYEGAFNVECQLREREEQWKRADEEATS